MKWKPGKKQISIMVSTIICAVVILLIYYVLFKWNKISAGINNIMGILAPIITGCVIGYILSPLLNLIEKKWLYPIYKFAGKDLNDPQYRKNKKTCRSISVFVTMAIFFVMLYAMFMILVPQLIRSVREIIYSFPIYIQNLQNYTDTYLNDNPSIRRTVDNLITSYSTTVMDFVKANFVPNISTALQILSRSMVNFVQVFFYFFVGTIVAIYILNSKEQFIGQAKKTAYAFLKQDSANEVIGACRFAHNTFTGFIMGKIIDSLIIGLICFIAISILQVPYPVLLSFAVGITNLIPFFGPYIGGGFGLILLIMINPIKALVFLVTIVILQQFDGNILGPLILGNSTGLSSFWVIFAIMFFGGIWGPVGWLIGVPVFACIYALLGHITKNKLRAKKLPRDTSSYVEAAYIEDDRIVKMDEADNLKYYVRGDSSVLRRIFKFYKKGKRYIENVTKDSENTDASDDTDKSGKDDK